MRYRALTIALVLMLAPLSAYAQPGIPHQFYGTAKYTNGSNITSGNVIVKIGTTQVASEPITSGKYGYNPNLLFVTDTNNNRVGSTLKFFIDTVDTGTTAVFANGGYTELNLTTAVPSDTVSGNGSNVSLSSVTAGEADMPTGATKVVLTDSTVLDFSSSKVSQTSANVTVGGNVVALTQAVTLQSGVSGSPVVLTNSNLGTVSASIPDGTKIQGPSGWDGKVAPPVVGTSSGTAPAGFSVGSTVISVGSSAGTLVFDNPVTLLLSGVTGAVGYKPAGSDTWLQITNTCGGTYTTPTAPTFPGECAISNGTDTKIVTYHFTSFGSLTANPTPVPSGGGGGGGGGGSTSSTPTTSTTTTVTTTPIVTTISTPQVTSTQGQVLGAATYNFTKALAVGSRGADITALQQFLLDNKFYTGPVTGYFGQLTRTAVVAFQKARGIAQAGNVGPQTRAALNKGVIATTVETTSNTTQMASVVSSLSTVQVNAIIGLLEAFGADAATIAKVRTALGR